MNREDGASQHSNGAVSQIKYTARLFNHEEVSRLVTEGKALLDQLKLDLLEEKNNADQRGKKLNISQVNFALRLRQLINSSLFSSAKIYKRPDVNLKTMSQEGRKQTNGYQGMSVIAGGYITWFSKIGNNWQLNYSKQVDW